MARILFTEMMAFLLPTAIYAVWVWYRTRYAARHGGEAPRLEKGPWPLLFFLGALLVLAILGATALLGGGSADSHYVPPRIEGGQVVPGHLEPKKP
jgi:hypothetical protein